MQRDSGVFGRLIAHGVIDGLIPPVWETRAEDFPLVHEVLDHADGVIVHSALCRGPRRESGVPRARLADPDARLSRAAAGLVRSRLPRPASIVIGCFGNLNPAKRLRNSFRRSRSYGSDIRTRCSSSRAASRAATISSSKRPRTA